MRAVKVVERELHFPAPLKEVAFESGEAAYRIAPRPYREVQNVAGRASRISLIASSGAVCTKRLRNPKSRKMDVSNINLVKVFSATKSRERGALGERVTDWLRAHPGVEVLRAVVSLTSDREFHCLSIVIIGHEEP